MSTPKNAVMRALLNGSLLDLYPKTLAELVLVDDATLADKLEAIATELSSKATTSALNSGLAGKADTSHSHAQSDISGLTAALDAKASTTALTEAINALRNEILGGDVEETMNSIKELADLLADNEDLIEALNAAISGKADKTTVETMQDSLGDLATKDIVSETDLDSNLQQKVNSAAQGNHTHANKALLDTYSQTEANLADAVSKKHSHANIAALNSVSAAKVSAWDAKSRVLVSTSQPSDLAAGDLWIQLLN